MKRKAISCLLAGSVLLSCVSCAAPSASQEQAGNETAENPFVEKIHALIDEPEMEYWPASRWWLAEGLHTDETIRKSVKELYEMGIGGIEIVCMPEDNVDNDSVSPVNQETGERMSSKALYGWGSEEWQHDTQLIIEEATKYGMGFSMTSGTHWSNANLPEAVLMPDDDGAGKSLGYAVQTVSGGDTFSGPLQRSFKSGDDVVRQDLVAVVAMKRDPSSDAEIAAEGETAGTIDATENKLHMVYDDSATQVLTDLVTRDGSPVTEETKKDPTGEVEFTLEWAAPDAGTYDIYSFWIQATGQSPTPSSTRNFTINYVDPYGMEAFLKYYDESFFTPELKELIRKNGKGEIYMDSLEISTVNGATGQFWGYTLLDEFEKRQGYDLTPYLPYIIRQGGRAQFTIYPTKMLGSDGVKEEKIHTDLYETMTDMYIENVLTPLREYLHEEMGMKLRAEVAYNLPYDLSRSAGAVDYIETESLEYITQGDSLRTFAGAANLYGLRLSSETGAVRLKNYAVDMEEYLKIINTQFAFGVSHNVLHGYASIEGAEGNDEAWEGTYWPGHEGMNPMWSERWGSRQPYSAHYDDLMRMLSRNQAILQQGKAQVDIAILCTDYYNNHDCNQSFDDKDSFRNRKALFMKDLSLQDAGYTYNFFSPDNLDGLEEKGITEYREGEGLLPDTAGYQAVIVYQDSINVSSAQKLLALAENGLPVIIVNGMVDRFMTSTEANFGAPKNTTNKLHKQAGMYTLSNDGRDPELAEVMAQLKALDTVVELTPENLPGDAVHPNPEVDGYEDAYFTGKTGILEALQSLGVRPRAEYGEANRNFLTVSRKTDDTLYLWAYNFMTDQEEADTVTVSVSESGRPYKIDTWSGEVTEMASYGIRDGRTEVELTLDPGETAVIALDLSETEDQLHAVSTTADGVIMQNGEIYACASESGKYTTELSDGSSVTTDVTAPENVTLAEWSLAVEDWNAGEKNYITEDRGLGYETKEVFWTTEKVPIEAGTVPLVPWSDIPGVGRGVSGIGTYTATFELPQDWSESNGAYVDIESLCGGTAAVFVNGQKAPALDLVSRKLDISEYLKPGENTIEVQTATTLQNKMIALGYPRMVTEDPWTPSSNRFTYDILPAAYGMVGDVTLVTYTVAKL